MTTDDVHDAAVPPERDSEYWHAGANDNGEPDYGYGPGAPDGPDDDDTIDSSAKCNNLLPEQIVQMTRKHKAKEARRASIANFYRQVNAGISTGKDSARPRRRIRRVSFAAGDTFADDVTISYNESENLAVTNAHQVDDLKYEYSPGASDAGSYEEPDYGYGDGAPDAKECYEDGPVEEHILTVHGKLKVAEAADSRLASIDASTNTISRSKAHAFPPSRWGCSLLSDVNTSDDRKLSKPTRAFDQGTPFSNAVSAVRPSITRWSSGPLHGSNGLGDRKPMGPSRRPSLEKEATPDRALPLHSQECGSSRLGSIDAPRLTTKFDNNRRRPRRRTSIGEAPAQSTQSRNRSA